MAETATTAPGQHCCIGLNKCGDAWLKSWNSVVEASDLKMLQSYYKNSAPFFKIYFCLCSPVMRRSRWLKAPIIPSSPSFLPSLVTAPLLQPAAAQQPGLLSAINIPSLAGDNLSPNLCRLSFQLLVVELVHYGFNSILKVNFFGTPCMRLSVKKYNKSRSEAYLMLSVQ